MSFNTRQADQSPISFALQLFNQSDSESKKQLGV